jgi:peptidoglycan/xylan/chitin deacetylase (PgdA/CDA1 family)
MSGTIHSYPLEIDFSKGQIRSRIRASDILDLKSTASYIIFADGTNYYAKNGSTGIIEYSDANVVNVLNYVFGKLQQGVVALKDVKMPVLDAWIKEGVAVIEQYNGKVTIYTSKRAYSPSSVNKYACRKVVLPYVYLHEALRFENASLWTVGSGAIIEEVTDKVIEGNKAIKLTSFTSDYTGYMEVSLPSPVDLRDKVITLWFYVEDLTPISQLYLYAIDTAGNWANVELIHSSYTKTGWNRGVVVRALLYSATSVDTVLSNVVKIRFTLSLKSGYSSGSVILDDMKVFSITWKPIAILRFDDSYHTDHYYASMIMAKYGVRGVHGTVVSQVGYSASLSIDMLKKMQSYRWDIASHSMSHPYMSQISLGKQHYEVFESHRWLVENGFERGARIFIYPYEDFSEQTNSVVSKYFCMFGNLYYTGSRSFIFFNNIDIPFSFSALSTSTDTTWDNTKVANMKSSIDYAYSLRLPVVILFHRIDISRFEEVLQYILSKGFKIVTFSDILDGNVDWFSGLKGSGVATISASSTKVTVSHGLATIPTKVLITPLASPPGKLWVENITSTSFDIVTDTAPALDLKVSWQAEV